MEGLMRPHEKVIALVISVALLIYAFIELSKVVQ